MSFERMLRILLTVVVWGGIGILFGIGYLAVTFSGATMPGFTMGFVVGILVMLNLAIWNPYTWDGIKQYYRDDIQRQLDEHFRQMSPEELQEVRAGLEEARAGINDDAHIRIGPMKIPFSEVYESQRGDLTQRIRQMSDSELIALRERLAQGAVQDDSLRAWLEEDARARHP